MIFEDLQPTKRLSANRFHAVLGLLGLFTPDNVIVMGGSPLLLHPHLGTISIVLVCYPISTVTTKCWLIKLFWVSSKKTNQYFHVIMESFNCSYSVLNAIFKLDAWINKLKVLNKRKYHIGQISTSDGWTGILPSRWVLLLCSQHKRISADVVARLGEGNDDAWFQKEARFSRHSVGTSKKS